MTEDRQPSVEIVILNWNGREDTIECLRSLDRVTYENKRITVVDNASTDGSAEVVRKDFPEVDLICNEQNLMFAGGNNAGIRESLDRRADYVLLLNNDTIVHEGFLTALVDTAIDDEKIGIVGPKINYHDDVSRIWFAGGAVDFSRGKIYHMGLNRPDAGGYDERRDVDYITGCCMLVKREVFEEIGVLDTGYFIYTEDVDFCFRARTAGFEVVYEPSAIIWHKVSASSGGGLTAFKVYHKVKSNLRFFRKHGSWYNWLTIPVFVGLRSIGFVTGRLIRGDFGSIGAMFRGFTDSVLRKSGGREW